VKANIFLIGFSTTGKSVAGQLLAQRLGWAFVDTDLWVMGMADKPIPAIFAEEGENHFRALEREALAEAAACEHTVIATGGGAVIAPENRALMRHRGHVILLEATPETILQRLQAVQAAEPRPLLTGPDPLRRITELKAQRQSYYLSLADIVVTTDGLNVEAVVERLIQELQTLI